MHKIQNYWFYLEPYTFIFKGKDKTVLYNTLNSEYLECPSNVFVDELIEELLISPDYCVTIDHNKISNIEFHQFIETVRSTFSGDYTICDDTKKKPYIFKPILRLKDNYHKLIGINDKSDLEGNNILRYLNELTIFLTIKCEQHCRNCFDYHKQFLSCAKFPNTPDFPIKELLRILDQMEKNGIGRVNFLGGDIFKYKYLQLLIPHLGVYSFSKRFIVNSSHINDRTIDIIKRLLESKCFVMVLFEPSSKIINYMDALGNTNIEYVVIIDSEKTLSAAIDFIETNPELCVEFYPFFNDQNLAFFKDYVFMNIKDLLDLPISKKTIFRHQILNENFFGKLFIKSNGDIYANLNMELIGNAFENIDSINKAVYHEMKNGLSWFKLRNEEPCSDCCNKHLCPSPSNYEIILGKPNLCDIK